MIAAEVPGAALAQGATPTTSKTANAKRKPPAPVTEAPAPAGKPAAPPSAEGEGAGEQQPSQQPAAVKIERGAGGKRVYRITTAITIEGKIQKPEAFYVLQKSSINYEWQDLKKEFLPKILDSVSKAPF
jgi:hypothetical protein